MEISVDLKKKIGQMFMCGFDSLELNDHVNNLIDNYYLGNIILFSRNINNKEQVRKLNKDLTEKIEKKSGVIPLISIDEVGGSVSRLRGVLGEFLGHYAIASLNDETVAYEVGIEVGSKMRDLGINMNLAPVADINSNPKNIGIGIRSFGSNADVVKRMAYFMGRGYERSNILPTFKHFPGLGDITVDSHHDLPILEKSLNELHQQELVPFKYAIDNGIRAIMVSHIIVECLDQKYPASMSKLVITGLLKNDLNYEGLVVTDCFEMGAIQNNYGIGEATVIAINAGVDILDISHTEDEQIKAIEAVYKAVEDGRITEERINESYRKIINEKIFLAEESISAPFDTMGFKAMYQSVLEKNGVARQNINKGKTCAFAVNQFVSNPAEDVIENPVNIADIVAEEYKIRAVGFSKNLSDDKIKELTSIAEDFENIILFVGDMDIYPQQHKLYNSLRHKNVYLIDTRLKVTDLKYLPKMHFNAYSYTNSSVEILCNYLFNKVF